MCEFDGWTICRSTGQPARYMLGMPSKGRSPTRSQETKDDFDSTTANSSKWSQLFV